MKKSVARVNVAPCFSVKGAYREGKVFSVNVFGVSDNVSIANHVAKQYPGHTIKSIQWN